MEIIDHGKYKAVRFKRDGQTLEHRLPDVDLVELEAALHRFNAEKDE